MWTYTVYFSIGHTQYEKNKVQGKCLCKSHIEHIIYNLQVSRVPTGGGEEAGEEGDEDGGGH